VVVVVVVVGAVVVLLLHLNGRGVKEWETPTPSIASSRVGRESEGGEKGVGGIQTHTPLPLLLLFFFFLNPDTSY